jgi:hypothetical protein
MSWFSNLKSLGTVVSRTIVRAASDVASSAANVVNYGLEAAGLRTNPIDSIIEGNTRITSLDQLPLIHTRLRNRALSVAARPPGMGFIRRQIGNLLIQNGELVVTFRTENGDISYRTVRADTNDAPDFLKNLVTLGYIDIDEMVYESDGFTEVITEDVTLLAVQTMPDFITSQRLERAEASDRMRAMLAFGPFNNALRVAVNQVATLYERRNRGRRGGGFFPFLIKDEYYNQHRDMLQRFQIYSESTSINEKDNTPCIIYSLRQLYGTDIITNEVESALLLKMTGYTDIVDINIKLKALQHIFEICPEIPELFVVVDLAKSTVKRLAANSVPVIAAMLSSKDQTKPIVNWSHTIVLEANHFFAPRTRSDYTLFRKQYSGKNNRELKMVQIAAEAMQTNTSAIRDSIVKKRTILDETAVAAQLGSITSGAVAPPKMSLRPNMSKNEIDLSEAQTAEDEEFYSYLVYRDNQEPLMMYCDLETYPVIDNQGVPIQRPALCVISLSSQRGPDGKLTHNIRLIHNDPGTFNCTTKCMQMIKLVQAATHRNIQVWFFNVKFDFAMFIQNNNFSDLVNKNSTLYSARIINREVPHRLHPDSPYFQEHDTIRVSRLSSERVKQYNRPTTIEFRDLMKIHPGSLSALAESLKVENKLQGVNYAWHTHARCSAEASSNPAIGTCTLDEYQSARFPTYGNYRRRIRTHKHNTKLLHDAKMASKEAQRTILLDIDRGYYSNGVLQASKMYEDYCVRDVTVLAECCILTSEALARLPKHNTPMLHEVRTASSLALKYVRDLLDGIHSPVGPIRYYLAPFVHGGRVYAAAEYVGKVLHTEIVPVDATSMYPGAIIRCGKLLGGFPAGLPKVIKDTAEFETILKTNKYFVGRFRMVSAPKKRLQFPIIRSTTLRKNKLTYTNEHTGDEIHRIGRITYEEYCLNKHGPQCTMEFLGGIWWPAGYCGASFGTVIEQLMNERKKHKHTNVALSKMIKLIMNSCYGVMAQKSTFRKYSLMPNMDALCQLATAGSNVCSVSTLSNTQSLVTSYDLEDNIEMPTIIAIVILEMSKRILNEVIFAAHDVNCLIYYGDTDSLHMAAEGVDRVRELFEFRYNRKMFGSNAGEYHNDDYDESTGHLKDRQIITAIYNGPKAYLEITRGRNDRGEYECIPCCRLKGVNGIALREAVSRQQFDAPTHCERYIKMYEAMNLTETNRKGVLMCLNPTDFEVDSFKYNGFGQVTVLPKGSHTRRIRFGDLTPDEDDDDTIAESDDLPEFSN